MTTAPRIAVIGSANVDLTTFADRFPRPGETIFAGQFHMGFGGKGANQAVAARLCGADVLMLARIGDDLFGPATLRNFESYGIDTARVVTTPGVSSGVAPIFVEPSGQNRILVVKGANDRLTPADIDAAAPALATAAFIVLQLEIPLETVYYALRFAREHGVRTILNPAPAQPLDARYTALADYLVPNESEAEALTGLAASTIDEARICAHRLIENGAPRVIITLGANGALLAGPEGSRHIPPFPVSAIDTSGAGDAFIGSLACFLAQGFAEDEAIARANLYAALSTLEIGTQRSFVPLARFEAEWSAKSQQASAGNSKSPESPAQAGK